ncbi:MGMT family protein [Aestuariibacter salexigens]|uniref:MGMT family protein n=1 Tax=Aestuariibacter salexigens TaxID=226010 RepID=UPI000420E09A|nr:methylated-DNA--[protein]-cysteine S-methyltransferase [Aestuariibacter salexigens]
MSSPSHKRIWKVVSLIPQGKVASYGQIADLAGLPGRARMVSKALKCTPEELAIPWHRVLRADGKIAFPVGHEFGLQQQQLLREEGLQVDRLRVNLSACQWQPDLPTLLFALDY